MKKHARRFASFIVILLVVAGPLSKVFAAAPPPVEQSLVREGDLALKLAAKLTLGTPTREAEAEKLLTRVGIAPANGWIADYPVTPDIVADLASDVRTAAASGKLPVNEAQAMRAFDATVSEFGLAITPAPHQEEVVSSPPPDRSLYANPSVVNNYYYDNGPPVITYYPPPADYLYLYAWVPFSFFSFGFWFPGYYCLYDFYRPVYWGPYGCAVVTNYCYDRYHHCYVDVHPPHYHRYVGDHWERGRVVRHSERYASPEVRRSAENILRSRVATVDRAGTRPTTIVPQRSDPTRSASVSPRQDSLRTGRQDRSRPNVSGRSSPAVTSPRYPAERGDALYTGGQGGASRARQNPSTVIKTRGSQESAYSVWTRNRSSNPSRVNPQGAALTNRHSYRSSQAVGSPGSKGAPVRTYTYQNGAGKTVTIGSQDYGKSFSIQPSRTSSSPSLEARTSSGQTYRSSSSFETTWGGGQTYFNSRSGTSGARGTFSSSSTRLSTPARSGFSGGSFGRSSFGGGRGGR